MFAFLGLYDKTLNRFTPRPPSDEFKPESSSECPYCLRAEVASYRSSFTKRGNGPDWCLSKRFLGIAHP